MHTFIDQRFAKGKLGENAAPGAVTGRPRAGPSRGFRAVAEAGSSELDSSRASVERFSDGEEGTVHGLSLDQMLQSRLANQALMTFPHFFVNATSRILSAPDELEQILAFTKGMRRLVGSVELPLDLQHALRLAALHSTKAGRFVAELLLQR